MTPKLKLTAVVLIFAAIFLFFFADSFKGRVASLIFKKITATRSLIQLQTYDFFKNKTGLVKENRELKLSLAEMEAEKSILEFSPKENTPRDFIEAIVIFRPPAINYDQIILGKGSKDGVTPGQPVLAGKNMLIGTIGEVFDESSRAVLFSSYGLEQNVFLEKSGLAVSAVGQGNNELAITLPRDFQADENAAVFSLTDPPYIIGYVVYTQTSPNSSVKTLKIKQPFNMYNLYSVNILK